MKKYKVVTTNGSISYSGVVFAINEEDAIKQQMALTARKQGFMGRATKTNEDHEKQGPAGLYKWMIYWNYIDDNDNTTTRRTSQTSNCNSMNDARSKMYAQISLMEICGKKISSYDLEQVI